ncbi:MAG: hypothetical protein DRP55_09785, partial [Spirochaetes bacterium]
MKRININKIKEIKHQIPVITGVKKEDFTINYEEIPNVAKIIREIGNIEKLTREKKMNIQKIVSSIIDHTLLKAFATSNDVKKLHEEAEKFNFLCACVNSSNIKLA